MWRCALTANASPSVTPSPIDDQQKVITPVDKHQVVDDAAMRIEQQAVALLVQPQAHDVHGDQSFQSAGRIGADQPDLAHVRHVKQARCGAGVFVFGHQACGVLHRHVIARKRNHACPQGQMQAMQRGFEQCVVGQSGLQPKAVPAPCQHREPCCPLYLRDSDCQMQLCPFGGCRFARHLSPTESIASVLLPERSAFGGSCELSPDRRDSNHPAKRPHMPA